MAVRAGKWLRRLCGVMALSLAVFGVANLAAAAEQVHFLTWDAYTAPAVIDAFKRETGIDVVIHPVLSDAEMFDRVKREPGKYDVVNPADYMTAAMIREGLLEKIEPHNLPNFANLDDAWRARSYDLRNQFSVPLHWGTTSFVVDSSRFKGDVDTYRVLFEPPAELRAASGILKGASSLIKAALIYRGLPTCSVDKAHLAQIRALLLERFAGATIVTASDAVERLADPALLLSVAWNGDALRARLKRPALRFAYPREGVLVFSDTLASPKGARNPAGAKKFIDFMMRPDIAAAQSNFTRYANAIRGSDAFIDAELLDAPEVIVPTSVDVSFQQYCAPEAQFVHDALMEEVLTELGKITKR